MATENLRSEATIWLFGREVLDIELTGADDKAKDRKLARIYAFSFHNELFYLRDGSTLFVVTGKGKKPPYKTIEESGLGLVPRGLADDLEAWECDMADLSVRLDVMSGNLERILLDEELAEEGLQDFVRGGSELGLPSNLDRGRGKRRGRWRSKDD